MVLRDLVTGGGGCAVNPLSSLSNTILGSSFIAWERLSELPREHVEVSTIIDLASAQSLPGSEFDISTIKCPVPKTSVFLQGFQGMHENIHAEGENEIIKHVNQVDAIAEHSESVNGTVIEYEDARADITKSEWDYYSEFKTRPINQDISHSLECLTERSVKKLSDTDNRKIQERINVIAKHFVTTDDFRYQMSKMQNIASPDGLGSFCNFGPSQSPANEESSNQEICHHSENRIDSFSWIYYHDIQPGAN